MNVSSSTSTQDIIESLVTSGLPVKDILRQLESFGVEWYVTEQGDVMVKYWQVGAEGLVPPEHVANIRASQSVPAAAGVLEWLSANLDDLRARYSGQWVAIVDHQVIASAPDIVTLICATADLEGVTPFITQIPADPVVWHTAFSNRDHP